MQINATEIYADYDSNNVLVLAFSTGFTEDQGYFMIQNALEYDEQDVSLGMNTYYIEKSDASMGLYGGIEHVKVERDTILFSLSDTAQERLREPHIEVHLACDDTVYTNLVEKLSLVLNGVS